MSRKFLTPIDLNGNEIQNVIAQNLAGDPGSPANGQFWYQSTAHAWRVRINGSTRDITWVTGSNPTAEAVGSTVSVGTAADAARSDHRHAMPGVATTGVDGFMPGADKTKLDNATASATVSTLALRDNAGRFQAVSPSVDADVATKGYVDTVAVGLDAKASVRAATIAALADAYTATGSNPTVLTRTGNGAFPAVDTSITLSATQRVLIKNESGANEKYNGVYTVTSAGSGGTPWVLTRATDTDTWAELVSAYVFVEEGPTMGDSGWVCTVDTGGTIDTTAVAWAQFTGGASYTAGNGLTLVGSLLAVGAGTGIAVTADTVSIATNGVTDALFRQSAALSVVANATNVLANVADLTASADYQILRRSGTALAFGSIDLSQSGAVGASILGYANGGTGQSTWAAGDLLYASALNTLGKLAVGATAGMLLNSSGTAPQWSTAATLGITRKYSVDVGNGALTDITVNHALNTRDVTVAVYQNSSTWDEVECDVKRTDANNVTLTFAVAPTSAQYRCVVVG